MDGQDQIKRGMLWLGSATVAARLLDVAATLAVVGLLSKAQMGLATMAISACTVLESLSGLGIGYALVQAKSSTAEEDSGGDEELESGKFPYLYAAVRVGNRNCILIDDAKRYQLPRALDGREVKPDDSASVSAAQGKIFWSRVKQDCWKRIKHINVARLQKLGVEPPVDWLNRDDL